MIENRRRELGEVGGGDRGRAEGWMDGMSQGRKDKCLRSLVMSGDRSPAGMISAAVIDSLPPALR